MTMKMHAGAWAAALMLQAAGAQAGDGFALTEASGQMDSSIYVTLGALSPLEQSKYESALEPVPGVPLAHSNHLDWSLEDERPPAGSGQRSAGAIHGDASFAFTLSDPGPGQTTITSSGQAASSASWWIQAANGDSVPGGHGIYSLSSNLVLRFTLDRAADLRLAGTLATTASGQSAFFGMTQLLPDGNAVSIYTTNAVGAEAADILSQQRLEAGNYAVVSSLHHAKLLECCDAPDPSTLVWDYVLELSALPPVPEPGAPGLMLAGLGALVAWRRGAVGPGGRARYRAGS